MPAPITSTRLLSAPLHTPIEPHNVRIATLCEYLGITENIPFLQKLELGRHYLHIDRINLKDLKRQYYFVISTEKPSEETISAIEIFRTRLAIFSRETTQTSEQIQSSIVFFETLYSASLNQQCINTWLIQNNDVLQSSTHLNFLTSTQAKCHLPPSPPLRHIPTEALLTQTPPLPSHVLSIEILLSSLLTDLDEYSPQAVELLKSSLLCLTTKDAKVVHTLNSTSELKKRALNTNSYSFCLLSDRYDSANLPELISSPNAISLALKNFDKSTQLILKKAFSGEINFYEFVTQIDANQACRAAHVNKQITHFLHSQTPSNHIIPASQSPRNTFGPLHELNAICQLWQAISIFKSSHQENFNTSFALISWKKSPCPTNSALPSVSVTLEELLLSPNYAAYKKQLTQQHESIAVRTSLPIANLKHAKNPDRFFISLPELDLHLKRTAITLLLNNPSYLGVIVNSLSKVVENLSSNAAERAAAERAITQKEVIQYSDTDDSETDEPPQLSEAQEKLTSSHSLELTPIQGNSVSFAISSFKTTYDDATLHLPLSDISLHLTTENRYIDDLAKSLQETSDSIFSRFFNPTSYPNFNNLSNILHLWTALHNFALHKPSSMYPSYAKAICERNDNSMTLVTECFGSKLPSRIASGSGAYIPTLKSIPSYHHLNKGDTQEFFIRLSDLQDSVIEQAKCALLSSKEAHTQLNEAIKQATNKRLSETPISNFRLLVQSTETSSGFSLKVVPSTAPVDTKHPYPNLALSDLTSSLSASSSLLDLANHFSVISQSLNASPSQDFRYDLSKLDAVIQLYTTLKDQVQDKNLQSSDPIIVTCHHHKKPKIGPNYNYALSVSTSTFPLNTNYTKLLTLITSQQIPLRTSPSFSITYIQLFNSLEQMTINLFIDQLENNKSFLRTCISSAHNFQSPALNETTSKHPPPPFTPITSRPLILNFCPKDPAAPASQLLFRLVSTPCHGMNIDINQFMDSLPLSNLTKNVAKFVQCFAPPTTTPTPATEPFSIPTRPAMSPKPKPAKQPSTHLYSFNSQFAFDVEKLSQVKTSMEFIKQSSHPNPALEKESPFYVAVKYNDTAKKFSMFAYADKEASYPQEFLCTGNAVIHALYEKLNQHLVNNTSLSTSKTNKLFQKLGFTFEDFKSKISKSVKVDFDNPIQGKDLAAILRYIHNLKITS